MSLDPVLELPEPGARIGVVGAGVMVALALLGGGLNPALLVALISLTFVVLVMISNLIRNWLIIARDSGVALAKPITYRSLKM